MNPVNTFVIFSFVMRFGLAALGVFGIATALLGFMALKNRISQEKHS